MNQYINNVETEFRKKMGQNFSMSMLREVHDFYSNCLEQLISDLGLESA